MKVLGIIVVAIFLQLIKCERAKTVSSDESLSIISRSEECSNDVKKLCGDVQTNTDVAILTCLQDSDKVMRKISRPCQNYLWTYKHNLTTSDFFDKITKEECETDLAEISECRDAAVGHKAPCLLDHKDKIVNERCSKFLYDVGVIIFSDYHLIYKFIDKCKPDIRKFKCGRITKPGSKDPEKDDDSEDKPLSETTVELADYVTSQAHTLDCLIDKIQDINTDCQHQILRVSELQSNDYHLNRGLYLACREDRETLCPKVKSGEGRVYECLMKEKFSDKMSEKCRKELTRKQQVESLDAEADYPLFHRCKQDMISNKCLKNADDINHDIVFMSVILMCLHDAEVHGKRLEAGCKSEIAERRAEMVEDFKISPEALSACKVDVKEHCKKFDNEPGEVVHCLMNLAKPDLEHKEGQLTSTCKVALLQFVKAANPSENVMSGDVAIREACSSSYLALCADIVTDKEAFQCLIHNLNDPKMATSCRDKITSLLYFISLDISIDDQLNMACHADGVRLCNGPDHFEESQKTTSMQKQLMYHCMYSHFKKDRVQLDLAEARGVPQTQANISLSADCSQQIFNLIRVQASKIELDPIIFVPCFDDLSRMCRGAEHSGKEHECLQKNVKALEPKCRKAVIEFSQLEDVDSRLNRMLSEACVPMVEKFCAHEKPEHMLVCLSEHKMHPQMSDSCQAAIEHIQIMSLEEYHIDHRFASFCGPEIESYCKEELSAGKGDNNKAVSKATIVSCLSRTVIKKLLNGDKHPLSDQCRRQFTFELLQRSESIKLDPGLTEDCASEIKEFCSKVKTKHINSCLREHQDELKQDCHKRLFKRERLEALDADFDGELQQKCSQMIQERCHNVPGRKLFRCLHRVMKSDGFDKGCRRLILSRLERRMNDIRLNPGLIEDCRIDIEKHCNLKNPNKQDPSNGIEYEGKIILCLKLKYTNHSASLERSCQQRILEIIIESNTNIRLDPTLRKRCSEDIRNHCKKEMTTMTEDAVNSVHNCLKHKFLRGELGGSECKQEVSRLLREGRADVHVDIELFDACESAIMRLCRSETFGASKKMGCLLSLVEDKKTSQLVGSRCLNMVKERKEMWGLVAPSDVQSVGGLYETVAHSSTRVYLVSMLGLMVAALILLGICCGRVTKRVGVDLKNK